MPRYTYECGSCQDVFSALHSMKEKLETCEKCGESLKRIPSNFSHATLRSDNSTSKQRVEKYIEECKEQLSGFKDETLRKEYNSDDY